MVLISDNATVVVYIKKQGGTVSGVTCDLAQEIFTLAECFPFYLTTWFILRWKNILTNQLSHLDQVLLIEWSLPSQVFNTICRA